MVTNNKKTLQEIKEIINHLKDNCAYEDDNQKQVWEQRITALLTNDNSQEISLNALDNLADLTLAEKSSLLTEIANLKEQLKTKEQELSDNQQALNQKDKEISSKITKELIDKLNQIANKNLELKRIPKKDSDGKELKDKDGNIIYEELIDIETLKDQLVKEVKGSDNTTKYSAIGAVVLGGLALLLQVYKLFTNSAKQKEEE